MIEANLVRPQPSSFLVAVRVRHMDADRCARELARLNESLADIQGFMSLDVIRREGGLGTDFYVVCRFQSSEVLERWRSSSERKSKHVEIEKMAITDVSRQNAAGSNVWFEPISMPSTPRPPLFWKRWLISMVAVYPPRIVLVTALKPVTALLPEALGLLVVALVLTGLNTAFIVPWLTRRLHGWLVARCCSRAIGSIRSAVASRSAAPMTTNR